jgi:glycosyltransferase involved in cell wall biosynthesis
MAAEVPVVASDIPGCADLVENETTGLLFAGKRSGGTPKFTKNFKKASKLSGAT